jgi:hypothetical protein
VAHGDGRRGGAWHVAADLVPACASDLKSRDFLTPNAWNRSTNRRFCHEVVDILRRNGCSVYAVYCRKANARKPLHQEWIIPRCFQVLAAKFACELSSIAPNKGGLITCDWSTYHMDRHVSDCVHTFVLAHQITTIVGGVTYGSSRSLVTIQVADLVAGAFRIYNEGGAHLLDLIRKGRLPDPCVRKERFVCIRPRPTRRVPYLASVATRDSASTVYRLP